MPCATWSAMSPATRKNSARVRVTSRPAALHDSTVSVSLTSGMATSPTTAAVDALCEQPASAAAARHAAAVRVANFMGLPPTNSLAPEA